MPNQDPRFCRTLGTCSLCGGPVTIEFDRFNQSETVTGSERCSACGAVPAAHGPIIPMKPADAKATGRNAFEYEPLEKRFGDLEDDVADIGNDVDELKSLHDRDNRHAPDCKCLGCPREHP